MRKILFLAFICLLFTSIGKAQCSWVDGQDHSLQSDAGRGVTSWDAHLEYATKVSSLADSYTFVGQRLQSLKACLYNERYARLYADLSLRIADYGIKFAGWRNAINNPVPNDGGCGYLDWSAHFDYVKKNGAGKTDQLVQNRLLILSQKLPRVEYAKLYADVSVIIAKAGVGSKSACGWIDGQDRALQSDPGRGVTNWAAHEAYINAAKDLTDSYTFVGNRLSTVQSCLQLESFADLYAELSVKIAEYGIKYAGWKNGPNNSLPKDGGCGYLVWKAHYDYVVKNGAGAVSGLVKNRLAALAGKMPKNEYAKLYADVSVLVAKYGVGK